MKLREFFINNRETLQLIYGVVLVILIPILIAYNTISIIGKYNESIEVALQRQALTTGRSIYILIKDDLNNEEAIQKKIKELSNKNSDFLELSILIPENENFRIIASSEEKNLGETLNFYYYQLAWSQPDGDGLATDSMKLATTEEGKQIVGAFSHEDRFWLVAMPMNDSSGKKQALLSMKISSKIVDDLTDDNRDASIYLLAITVLIIILFLSIAIRLWDYALLYKKIKEVDQMKDEFISIASHELRTPLTAIKGYLSLILEGAYGKIKSKEMKKGIERAIIASKRLETLVEDLLNVSRIEQKRLDVKNEKVKLEPIIQEVVSQLKIPADEKKLLLKYKKPKESLPLISADPERLKQALINLIGNSIKYTEKGNVEITTEIKDSKLEIKIADTGIGMSAEEQKHLFEKFHRVQNEKTAKIIGTGLGLWITKQIIELMNGKIYLESMKNVGTQVTIKLNLAKK
ncbi:MAG: HAMP domain-containing sensor histidine kinase [Patescibacteria group bacterium]|nr:HAMP domain-containing sensor histidine kinase [Patescibacteria group bacterium]